MTGHADNDILLSELTDGVLRLTLNDNKRRNALSTDMLARLSVAFTEAADDSRVRVVVLAATGPVFCSGHDLKEMTAARTMADKGHEAYQQLFAACASVMELIVRNPKPVIAEVAGTATAADHGVFQGYYFFHHIGLDRDARDAFRDHEHFEYTAQFCHLYDQSSFDPNYESLTLEFFEPMVRKVMERPRASIYMKEDGETAI